MASRRRTRWSEPLPLENSIQALLGEEPLSWARKYIWTAPTLFINATREQQHDTRNHNGANATDNGLVSPRKKAPSGHAFLAIDARTLRWRFPKPTRSHMSTRQPSVIALSHLSSRRPNCPPGVRLTPLDLYAYQDGKTTRQEANSQPPPSSASFARKESLKGAKSDLGCVCQGGRPFGLISNGDPIFLRRWE